MLGDFYAHAEAYGGNLADIDKAAEALGALRKAVSAMNQQNELVPELALLFSALPASHENALDSGKFRDFIRSSQQ